MSLIGLPTIDAPPPFSFWDEYGEWEKQTKQIQTKKMKTETKTLDSIHEEKPPKEITSWVPKKVTQRKKVYAFCPSENKFVVGEVLQMTFQSEVCNYQIQVPQGTFWTRRILKKCPK